jgi:hypothetical protein
MWRRAQVIHVPQRINRVVKQAEVYGLQGRVRTVTVGDELMNCEHTVLCTRNLHSGRWTLVIRGGVGAAVYSSCLTVWGCICMPLGEIPYPLSLRPHC